MIPITLTNLETDSFPTLITDILAEPSRQVTCCSAHPHHQRRTRRPRAQHRPRADQGSRGASPDLSAAAAWTAQAAADYPVQDPGAGDRGCQTLWQTLNLEFTLCLEITMLARKQKCIICNSIVSQSGKGNCGELKKTIYNHCHLKINFRWELFAQFFAENKKCHKIGWLL